MNNNSDELLGTCLNEYWEHVLQFNPTFATYIGDHRYNDKLEDLSEESIRTQQDYIIDLLSKTETIDDSFLDLSGQLNLRLLKKTLSNHLEFYRYKAHYIPLNQMSGAHIDFPQIVEFHPFHTVHDVHTYLCRLNAFTVQIDQTIELLKQGVQHRTTAFRRSIEHVLGQVEALSVIELEDNPFYQPLLKLSDNFSDAEKEELKKAVKNALSSSVTSAYKKLLHYLSNDYKQHCRDTEGIWSLPDGQDMYRFYVRYHTTSNLSPQEIHETGLTEVSRVSSEISTVIKKTGFTGGIGEFAEHIMKGKGMYPSGAEEIMTGYREILDAMDKELPKFFGRIPKAEYDIKEIEKYREQAAPAAYYYPPPKDFTRPGYFYVNTYKPEQRPKFGMEALAYHEAVPGHHLQIAVMQELKDIPDFRRYEGSTAFIEGWALYAEKLAKEMGFYQDIYSEYGRLTNEIWRAVRLVVDTGLHWYKWSRDDCIRYCVENTGLEQHEIEVEIDRYIVMPGQALSYKIGELKILQLREKLKKALGERFDIKKFHDRLLEQGALPLDILESYMTDLERVQNG
jgi:uncharacterized protein (DUF885 family)